MASEWEFTWAGSEILKKFKKMSKKKDTARISPKSKK